MGAPINRFLGKPLFVWLYGPAFIVFKASAYFPSFQWIIALACLFSYWLISSMLIRFFRLICNRPFAGIAVIITWISVLHVVGIAQAFGYSYAYISLSFYLVFYTCVLAILVLFCLFSRKIRPGFALLFNPLANTFLLIVMVVFITNGLRSASYIKATEQEHFHFQAQQFPGKNEDIVWILMDEYGSSTCLSEAFQFNNPMDSRLQQKGFVSLPSIQSRFPYTLFSVNGIFNMDDSIRPVNFFQGIDLLRHGSLIPALERSGYRFVNLGFFDMAQHPMIADRSGYPYQYVQQLVSGTLIYILYNKWKNTVAKCDMYNQEVFRELDDTLSVASTGPRFIWAHIPIPHEPFCRNSEGRLQQDSSYDGKNDSAYVKRKYIDYLQYGNRMLLSLLEKHPDISRKIVIISGDHGPRFPFLKNRGFDKQPFAAIHIPKAFDTAQAKQLRFISQLPGFLIKNVLN